MRHNFQPSFRCGQEISSTAVMLINRPARTIPSLEKTLSFDNYFYLTNLSVMMFIVIMF